MNRFRRSGAVVGLLAAGAVLVFLWLVLPLLLAYYALTKVHSPWLCGVFLVTAASYAALLPSIRWPKTLPWFAVFLGGLGAIMCCGVAVGILERFVSGLATGRKASTLLDAWLVCIYCGLAMYRYGEARTGVTSLRSSMSPIQRAPGGLLARVGTWILPRKRYQLSIEPLLADMQEEVFSAWAAGDVWRARWMRAYYTVAFWANLAAMFPLSLVQALVGIWKGAQ